MLYELRKSTLLHTTPGSGWSSDVRNTLTGMTSVAGSQGLLRMLSHLLAGLKTWLIQKWETQAGLDFLVLAKLASLAKLHSGPFLALGVGWIFFS